MALKHFFHVWVYFKTKKDIGRPFIGSSSLKDKYSKSSSASFLQERECTIVANLFNISE